MFDIKKLANLITFQILIQTSLGTAIGHG